MKTNKVLLDSDGEPFAVVVGANEDDIRDAAGDLDKAREKYWDQAPEPDGDDEGQWLCRDLDIPYYDEATGADVLVTLLRQRGLSVLNDVRGFRTGLS